MLMKKQRQNQDQHQTPPSNSERPKTPNVSDGMRKTQTGIALFLPSPSSSASVADKEAIVKAAQEAKFHVAHRKQ